MAYYLQRGSFIWKKSRCRTSFAKVGEVESVYQLGESVFLNAKQQILNSRLDPDEQDALLEEFAAIGEKDWRQNGRGSQ